MNSQRGTASSRHPSLSSRRYQGEGFNMMEGFIRAARTLDAVGLHREVDVVTAVMERLADMDTLQKAIGDVPGVAPVTQNLQQTEFGKTQGITSTPFQGYHSNQGPENPLLYPKLKPGMSASEAQGAYQQWYN